MMKKLFIGFLIAATLIVAVGTIGAVSAQSPRPADGTRPIPSGIGRGGMFGQPGGTGAVGTGLLHDYMVAAFADAFEMEVADLEAALADGTKMVDIALEKGLTIEEFKTLMVDARATALDAAVADGVLSAEQAEFLKTRGTGMFGNAGAQRGGRGMFGGGQMQNCPNVTTP